MAKTILQELWQALTVPIYDDWAGWLVVGLLWIAFAAILALIIYLILLAANTWFMPVMEGPATIVGKHFEESHTSTVMTMNPVTKMQTPVTTYHPDAWRLDIQLNNLKDSYYVDEETYVKLKVPQSIVVKYSTGRFWHSFSVKKILQ